jgi:hypothetical protein
MEIVSIFWHAILSAFLSWSCCSIEVQNRSQCVSWKRTYRRDCVGDLSKTTSFLLSQIAQQKADAPAKVCLFNFPPN